MVIRKHRLGYFWLHFWLSFPPTLSAVILLLTLRTPENFVVNVFPMLWQVRSPWCELWG